MKPSEIATRLTGISTPFFGVSWNPPQADIDVARKVLTFLEDRRVLYAVPQLENYDHAILSVLEIRHFLTNVMIEHGQGDELQQNLRALRAACRRFLEQMNFHPRHEDFVVTGPYDIGGHMLDRALGELRGVFGIHIAQLAVKYGLDVEEPLTAILPANPDIDDQV